MTSIQVNRINNYTSDVIIDNKKMTLVDTSIRDAEIRAKAEHKRRKVGNLLHHGAMLVGLLAFIYILSIAGHSDYCSEAGIVDEWSLMDYIVREAIGLITMGVCMKVSEYGVKLRGYYYGGEED